MGKPGPTGFSAYPCYGKGVCNCLMNSVYLFWASTIKEQSLEHGAEGRWLVGMEGKLPAAGSCRLWNGEIPAKAQYRIRNDRINWRNSHTNGLYADSLAKMPDCPVIRVDFFVQITLTGTTVSIVGLPGLTSCLGSGSPCTDSNISFFSFEQVQEKKNPFPKFNPGKDTNIIFRSGKDAAVWPWCLGTGGVDPFVRRLYFFSNAVKACRLSSLIPAFVRRFLAAVA